MSLSKGQAHMSDLTKTKNYSLMGLTCLGLWQMTFSFYRLLVNKIIREMIAVKIIREKIAVYMGFHPCCASL